MGSTQPGRAHLLHQQTQIGGRRPGPHAAERTAGRSSCAFYRMWVWQGVSAAPPAASTDTTGWRAQRELRQDCRAPFTPGNTGRAVLGDRGPLQPQLLGCEAVRRRQGLTLWLTGREAGVPTRHPGTWARRGRGQQRGQQPPPPRAALPVSLSPSFPPRAEGEMRAGRGPLAAPPIVFPFTGRPSKMARNLHPDQGKEEPHRGLPGASPTAVWPRL